ncbi:MAG: hypothetical protein LBK97_07975 [Prevotellaceae bacterium]|jgi:hypothetical protein|nr:hypothetical protein [Prevotellaceae bacterium]
MNYSKFSLADLLTVLGTLGFGFFCFLSLNFISLGETVPSIIYAVAIAMILGGLAFGAKTLKKTSRNFKTCIIWEWILLFLFAAVALIAIIPFSHYFTVAEQKSEIQQQLTASIEQAERMFTGYEDYANKRLGIYRDRLNSIVEAKKTNSGKYNDIFEGNKDDKEQVKTKMNIFRKQLYSPDYEAMRLKDSVWIASAKAIIANWKPIGIVNVIKTIENRVSSRRDELRQFSTVRAQGEEAKDFEYLFTFDDVTGKITELDSPAALAIAVVAGLYALMLLSYFITKRHPRYPGLKMIFGTAKSAINEIK